MKRILVNQRDMTDCGAACLVSIAAYYNLKIPVSRVRQFAGTDRQGTTVLGLVEAAEKLNFQVKTGKGNIGTLSKIPLPAIVHFKLADGLTHFVAVYKVNKKFVTIMDPATGRLNREHVYSFLEKWTSVLIILIPANNFRPADQDTPIIHRFWFLIKPHRNLMLQSVLAAVIYTVLGLSTSFYVQKIVDYVVPENNLRLLNLMGVVMIALLFSQLFIGYFKSLLGLRIGQYLDAQLILGYYRHLLRLPQFFFDSMRVGELISRVNDAVKIRIFINDIAMNIIVNFLSVGFSIATMLLISWKLALVTIVVIPVYLIIYKSSDIINKKYQRQIMENAAALETQLVESINAAGTIKRFGLEEYSNNKTESRFASLLRSIYKSNLKNLFIANACELSTQLFIITVLWTGGYFVIRHNISPGQLLSFYSLTSYFTHPVLSLINANKSMQDALIAADRLFEIVDLETEAETDAKILLTPESAGDIEFEDVFFNYGSRTPVFKSVCFSISKNSITAIVGESGSGKSTIISLIQNLYPVNKGQISIGGTDIRYISNKSLRRLISVVPQKIDLFAGTIIENIAIGDISPDVHRILQLSYLLGINDFVEKLPDGYNTVLNEQGINLSGGQRQRLAIARALYRNPEILILDEATSSLDPPGEKKVLETLIWFKSQEKTVIIIAHKISMIKNADRIIVLNDGVVVEEGSHEVLLDKKGHYKKLWTIHEV